MTVVGERPLEIIGTGTRHKRCSAQKMHLADATCTVVRRNA